MKLLIFLFVFLFTTILYCSAGINFTNHTGHKIRVAIVYFENNSWYSQGWWTIENNERAIIYNSTLQKKFFYYYAYSVSGDITWKGDYPFSANMTDSYKYNTSVSAGLIGAKKIGFDIVNLKDTLTSAFIELRTADWTPDNGTTLSTPEFVKYPSKIK